MDKKTISITGEAICKMKPDMCIISFIANKANQKYAECLQALNKEVSKILSRLKEIDISRDCLTTRDFYVKPYSIYNEELEEYEFVEYRGEHRIDIKIDNDNILINKVLSLLNNNEFTPKISIDFGLRDNSEIKEKALKMAIENAKNNAELIVKGLGVNLVEVIDIKYNFRSHRISSRRYDFLENMQICDMSEDFNIMSEDSEYRESISIIWSIG